MYSAYLYSFPSPPPDSDKRGILILHIFYNIRHHLKQKTHTQHTHIAIIHQPESLLEPNRRVRAFLICLAVSNDQKPAKFAYMKKIKYPLYIFF